METNGIWIRKAQPEDEDSIFWLLHSASISWNMEKIMANIHSLYVMTDGEKLIGVVCNNFEGGLNNICWKAIHPMYPEKALVGVFDNLSGVLVRD